jgi:hypothetical protein
VSQDGYISQVCLADFQHKAIRGNPMLLASSSFFTAFSTALNTIRRITLDVLTLEHARPLSDMSI